MVKPIILKWSALGKWLHHVALVAMVSGSQQTVVLQIIMTEIAKRLTCMTFLCTITLRNRMVAHTFLPSFDNANGCLCQKRLL